MERLSLSMLILNRKVLGSLLSMKEAISAVNEAFKQFSEDVILCPHRTVIEPKDGWMAVMPAFTSQPPHLAVKIVSVFPKNRELALPPTVALTALIDTSNGMPLALMDASYLTALRTGATSAIATKHLAPSNADTVAVIGSGVQARFQLLGVAEVIKPAQIHVYSLTRANAEKFAEEMSSKIDASFRVANSAREAVEKAQVVITATTSKTPVLLGKWLSEGVHINSIGAPSPNEREVDDEVVTRASKIVVELKEAALSETGDLIIPIKKGIISEDKVYAELGDLVTGRKPGRECDEEITLFKSVGLAVEDLAVAKLAYEKALAAKVGVQIELL